MRPARMKPGLCSEPGSVCTRERGPGRSQGSLHSWDWRSVHDRGRGSVCGRGDESSCDWGQGSARGYGQGSVCPWGDDSVCGWDRGSARDPPVSAPRGSRRVAVGPFASSLDQSVPGRGPAAESRGAGLFLLVTFPRLPRGVPESSGVSWGRLPGDPRLTLPASDDSRDSCRSSFEPVGSPFPEARVPVPTFLPGEAGGRDGTLTVPSLPSQGCLEASAGLGPR